MRAAIFLILATGCGRLSTFEDLAHATVGYLADRDFDGHVSTILTAEQLFALCPRETRHDLKLTKFRESFDKCLERFLFEDAKVESVTADLETFAPHQEGCGNPETVISADRIKVRVSARGFNYEFMIDDAIETPEGWRLDDDLSCPE